MRRGPLRRRLNHRLLQFLERVFQSLAESRVDVAQLIQLRLQLRKLALQTFAIVTHTALPFYRLRPAAEFTIFAALVRNRLRRSRIVANLDPVGILRYKDMNTPVNLPSAGVFVMNRALLLALSLCLAAPLRAEGPVSFRNDVMAVLSKAGCNLGTCHGNANGKGGFKLSL